MKMFVIVKYLLAKDIPDALKKEKKISVDDCYVDSDWKRTFIDKRLVIPEEPMGFKEKKKK